MMGRQLLDTERGKRIQLEVLDGIDRFCSERGLRYSLAYGTLIGAVRHKGFIPWDDDIDLMMPRPDYDRFRQDFNAEGLYLVDLAERDDCVETFVKVCKVGTVMVDKNFGRELWGVNVDVFPVDGAPSEDLAGYYSSLDRIRNKLFQICPYYKSVRKGRFKLMLKYALKRLRYFYPGSFMSLKRKLVDGQKAYPYEAAGVAGVYFAAEKTRTFLEKRIYDCMGTALFEGRDYPALKYFDEYLTSLYGDYMQLPPEEKRVSHHAYDSYIEISPNNG